MHPSPCERKAKDDCAWVLIENLAQRVPCDVCDRRLLRRGECAGSDLALGDLEESSSCPDCATAWLATMVTL